MYTLNSLSLMTSQRFKGYCCESGMSLFKWKDESTLTVTSSKHFLIINIANSSVYIGAFSKKIIVEIFLKLPPVIKLLLSHASGDEYGRRPELKN